MSQRFAQISDPHLSTLEGVQPRQLLNKRALGYLSWRRKRRFEHSPEVLQALDRDLAQRDYEQLLVTGDLTHIGLPAEFAQARDWLRALGAPEDVALVPGNHDACVRAPWEETFALWSEYMAPDGAQASDRPTAFPTLRVRGDIAFIGLSTATPKPPLMATGTAGAEQVARLGPVLEDTGARGLFRVVYLHHCPVAGEEKWRKRLTDAHRVQEVLEEFGAELVVHGHGHHGHYTRLNTRHGPVPVIAIPSVSALGLHGADIAEYNYYTVERSPAGWQLDINARRFDRTYGDFVDGESWSLALARRPVDTSEP